jgi:hypothetical protein
MSMRDDEKTVTTIIPAAPAPRSQRLTSARSSDWLEKRVA